MDMKYGLVLNCQSKYMKYKGYESRPLDYVQDQHQYYPHCIAASSRSVYFMPWQQFYAFEHF